MTIIAFRRISLPEAEEALAEIWNCLEEYNIPSPRIDLEFHRTAQVSMGIDIDDPVFADIVALRLSNWAATEHARLRCGGGSEVGGPSAIRVEEQPATRLGWQLVASARCLSTAGQRRSALRGKRK